MRCVRTTLTLDDDILAAARELADQRGASVGAVISELSRRGLEAERVTSHRAGRVPTFPARPGARPITMASVQTALHDE